MREKDSHVKTKKVILQSLNYLLFFLSMIFFYYPGCDTTSKVSTKKTSFEVSKSCGFDLLHRFGKEELTEKIVYMAEMFLFRCMTKNDKIVTFDQLW